MTNIQPIVKRNKAMLQRTTKDVQETNLFVVVTITAIISGILSIALFTTVVYYAVVHLLRRYGLHTADDIANEIVRILVYWGCVASQDAKTPTPLSLCDAAPAGGKGSRRRRTSLSSHRCTATHESRSSVEEEPSAQRRVSTASEATHSAAVLTTTALGHRSRLVATAADAAVALPTPETDVSHEYRIPNDTLPHDVPPPPPPPTPPCHPPSHPLRGAPPLCHHSAKLDYPAMSTVAHARVARTSSQLSYCCRRDHPPYTTVRQTLLRNNYRIVRLIGRGSFASVYLVECMKTQRQYALKYIICRKNADRLLALKECETLILLQGHPCVVSLVDMFMGYQFAPRRQPHDAAASPSSSPSQLQLNQLQQQQQPNSLSCRAAVAPPTTETIPPCVVTASTATRQPCCSMGQCLDNAALNESNLALVDPPSKPCPLRHAPSSDRHMTAAAAPSASSHAATSRQQSAEENNNDCPGVVHLSGPRVHAVSSSSSSCLAGQRVVSATEQTRSEHVGGAAAASPPHTAPLPCTNRRPVVAQVAAEEQISAASHDITDSEHMTKDTPHGNNNNNNSNSNTACVFHYGPTELTAYPQSSYAPRCGVRYSDMIVQANHSSSLVHMRASPAAEDACVMSSGYGDEKDNPFCMARVSQAEGRVNGHTSGIIGSAAAAAAAAACGGSIRPGQPFPPRTTSLEQFSFSPSCMSPMRSTHFPTLVSARGGGDAAEHTRASAPTGDVPARPILYNYRNFCHPLHVVQEDSAQPARNSAVRSEHVRDDDEEGEEESYPRGRGGAGRGVAVTQESDEEAEAATAAPTDMDRGSSPCMAPRRTWTSAAPNDACMRKQGTGRLGRCVEHPLPAKSNGAESSNGGPVGVGVSKRTCVASANHAHKRPNDMNHPYPNNDDPLDRSSNYNINNNDNNNNNDKVQGNRTRTKHTDDCDMDYHSHDDDDEGDDNNTSDDRATTSRRSTSSAVHGTQQRRRRRRRCAENATTEMKASQAPTSRRPSTPVSPSEYSGFVSLVMEYHPLCDLAHYVRANTRPSRQLAEAVPSLVNCANITRGCSDVTRTSNALTEVQLLSIAQQLSTALYFLHTRNPPVVHRDLKPENILIKVKPHEVRGELKVKSSDPHGGEETTRPSMSVVEEERNHAERAEFSVPPTPPSPDGPSPTRAAPQTRAARWGKASTHMPPGTSMASDTVVGGAAAAAGSKFGGYSFAHSAHNNNNTKNANNNMETASMTASCATSESSMTPSIHMFLSCRVNSKIIPICITDFGLAIREERHLRPGRGGGTRPYVAPEVWRGETCTASDMWSLGCVLYALATARLTERTVRVMYTEAEKPNFSRMILDDILSHNYSLMFATFVLSLLVVDPTKRLTAGVAQRCFMIHDGEVSFDPNSPFFTNVLDL